MHIGIDVTTWWNQRGFGRFTRLLVGHMLASERLHKFVLFTDQDPTPEMLRPNVRVVKVATSAPVTAAAVAERSRSLADLLRFKRAVAAESLDVMYFPAVYSWYPTGKRTPVVVTFHDAIAERLAPMVFPKMRGRLMWKAKTWLAKRAACKITTVSCTALKEISKFHNIPEESIAVIKEAPDPRFKRVEDDSKLRNLRTRLGIAAGSRLLVYVGGMAPHKNLIRLVEAYAQARAHPALDDVYLLLVGDPGGAGFHSNYAELSALVEETESLKGRVLFTGFLDDDDLTAIYSDALAVAMPSLSEGFGLPAVEAIACGTPVIAARGGAVEEVVGPAGLYFNPYDSEEISRTIIVIAADVEVLAELRSATLPRAAGMSWTQSANETLDLLERCARCQ